VGPGGDASDDRQTASPPADERQRSVRERYASARERSDALVRRAQTRFDQERERRSWLEIVWRSLRRMQRLGGPLMSGGLAYRIFLWELPMALVIVAVVGLFVDLGGANVDQLAHDVGLSAALAASVGQAVAQTESSAWWLFVLGLWLTLWTARSAVSALRLIHRIAWDQDELPKINQFVAPLVFSVFMLVALVGTIASERLRATGVVLSAMGWIAVIAASLALVAFGMSLLPRAGRPWPVVLPGAVLFTVVVRGMVIASQVYFAGKLDRVDDLYGSLGIAIVVLVWLYLLAWGWIAATFLNAGLQGVTGGRPGAEPHPAAESVRSE
jgi:uncharacterized BrkB/YihY/UPF0761 family membrane protein